MEAIMLRRTISRRGLFGQAAGIAAATLLPLPAIAETRYLKAFFCRVIRDDA